MEDQLFHRLCALNTRFYQRTAASFSSTRKGAWVGWEHLADLIARRLEGTWNTRVRDARALSIVDLACGNLRFETFLEKRFPRIPISFTAVDNCDAFPCTPVAAPCEFVQADLTEWLQSGSAAGLPHLPAADIAVCFGFMHHIPGTSARCALLQRLAEMLAPGGIGAVSLWDFAQDPKMKARAEASTMRAKAALGLPDLEEGDYILGWQDDKDAFRYCHSFSEDEILAIAGSLPPFTRLIERFQADGRTGTLNTYLIFEREC